MWLRLASSNPWHSTVIIRINVQYCIMFEGCSPSKKSCSIMLSWWSAVSVTCLELRKVLVGESRRYMATYVISNLTEGDLAQLSTQTGPWRRIHAQSDPCCFIPGCQDLSVLQQILSPRPSVRISCSGGTPQPSLGKAPSLCVPVSDVHFC